MKWRVCTIFNFLFSFPDTINFMNYFFAKNKVKEFQQESRNYDFKVMICDDENIVLKAQKRLLETICKEHNKEVYIETASNGLECLYKIFDNYVNKGISYNILLIDENMTVLNGTDAILLLRKLQSNKSINNFLIFSVTGHEDEENINRIMSSGCDGTVAKPLSKHTFLSLLIKCNFISQEQVKLNKK